MSNAVSALDGVSNVGFAAVTELGLCGMITLRGDLADSGFAAAVLAATGAAVPSQRKVTIDGAHAVAWMSPDELLIMLPHSEADAMVATLSGALAGHHALVANVSDARAVFSVTGAASRDVLAKLAPVDLSPEVFTVGDIRRSRLAQVPAAFWLSDEDTFTVVAFRSVAQYVFDVLSMSVAKGGEVGYHPA